MHQKAKTIIIILLLTIGMFFKNSFDLAISYSGYVKNTSGNPIILARVSVVGTSVWGLTDSSGAFSISGDDAASGITYNFAQKQKNPIVDFCGRFIKINNYMGQKVNIELYTSKGSFIKSINFSYSEKNISVDINKILQTYNAQKLYIAKIIVGNNVFIYRIVKISNSIAANKLNDVTYIYGLSKSSAVYTLEAAAAGYNTGLFEQNSAAATGLLLILSAQTSDTLNKFQQYYFGNGQIEDISSNKQIQLTKDNMVHVIVFPEGYTAADLKAGKYEADLRSYYQSIFAFRPMPFFREAFIIWKYPVASNSNIVVDGNSDTYFKIQVTSSGVSSSGLDTAVRKVWNLLTNFNYPPKRFYPSGGNTSYLCKNIIVQFLIYDPSRGRAGYSGITTRFTNPSSSNQRVSVSLGQDQSHEFMHAFGLLADEYYEADYGPLTSSTVIQKSAYITNVVYTDSCSRLPWKHLLKGGEFNPGVDSLVGAFGTNGRFHSEFKCLMNGTHDNAALFGGNGMLRVYDRLCNYCSEITAFRTYERTGILDNPETSWDIWINSYRKQYYTKFPFYKPSVVPQRNSAGQVWFMECR